MGDCSAGARSPEAVYAPAPYPPVQYSHQAYAVAAVPMAMPAITGVPVMLASSGTVNSEQRVWIGPSVCCDGCHSWCCITACVPYVTFGSIMQRAGLGNSAIQALVYFGVSVGLFLLFLILSAAVRLEWLVYLGILLMMFGFLYGGYWRNRIRHKFGIQGGSCVDDYCLHFWCSSCALCQEQRTLEYYRVHDGVWQGPSVVHGAVVVGQPMDIGMVPVYAPQQVAPMQYAPTRCG